MARTTYIGAATRNGHTFVVTVMKVEGRGEVPAAALLDWAFAAHDAVEPVGTLVDPAPAEAPTSASPNVSTPPTTPAVGPAATVAAGNQAAPARSGGSGGGMLRGVAVVGGTTIGAVAVLRARAVWRMRKARMRRAQRTTAAGPPR
jgi:D-alanyl-D-alanine carboxypeptidase (penicillin-binding protein 5/6)